MGFLSKIFGKKNLDSKKKPDRRNISQAHEDTGKQLSNLLDDARACEEKKEYEKMVSICSSAVKQFPNESEAHKLLGTAYAYLKNYTNSISSLHKSINLDDENADAYAMLGRTLLESGDYSDKANGQVLIVG